MSVADINRTVMRASLPVDLLDQLDAEARRQGIPTEALVGRLLVEHLPRIVAEAVRDRLDRAAACTTHPGSSAQGREDDADVAPSPEVSAVDAKPKALGP